MKRLLLAGCVFLAGMFFSVFALDIRIFDGRPEIPEEEIPEIPQLEGEEDASGGEAAEGEDLSDGSNGFAEPDQSNGSDGSDGSDPGDPEASNGEFEPPGDPEASLLQGEEWPGSEGGEEEPLPPGGEEMESINGEGEGPESDPDIPSGPGRAQDMFIPSQRIEVDQAVDFPWDI